MGQYYYVCNLDKKEYLHPHKFDDGLKLGEFGCSGKGTMTALAMLLAVGDGRGGGDFRLEMSGRWAGDRIKVIGDYADEHHEDSPYRYDPETDERNTEWSDISEEVIDAFRKGDGWTPGSLRVLTRGSRFGA